METLAQYDSAFWDCALDRGLRYPGRRTRKRIKKFINGLKIRHPHTPIAEFPLQLRYLVRIAARIGIRSNGDLGVCHVRGSLCPSGKIITRPPSKLSPSVRVISVRLRASARPLPKTNAADKYLDGEKGGFLLLFRNLDIF